MAQNVIFVSDPRKNYVIEVEYGNDDLVPDDLEMSTGGNPQSHDNSAYQTDDANQDNVSHKTSSTGICETSQTDYINNKKQSDDVETADGGGEVANEGTGIATRPAKSIVASVAQANVKMLFQHNEQVNKLCRILLAHFECK
jgi:hypothetical protein